MTRSLRGVLLSGVLSGVVFANNKAKRLAIRLTRWTGKSPEYVHPKHLLGDTQDNYWYLAYIAPAAAVLDVGCGNGMHSIKTARRCRHVVGVDGNLESLGVAVRSSRSLPSGNAEFFAADLERGVAVQGARFDTVVCLDLLEHVHQRDLLLTEIRRALKPGGTMLLSVPNRGTSWKRRLDRAGLFSYSDPDHKIEYTHEQLSEKVRGAGFEIDQILRLWVSRSSDGGQTFGAPSLVYQPANSTFFPDKPWMAINTFSGTATVGRIVATFTLFSNVNQDGGSIQRAYSDDGGVTWSAAGSINSSTTNAQGSQPVFLPNGNLAVVYWLFGTRAQPDRLETVISTDGGATFGTPSLITTALQYNERSIRTGSFLPSAAADRSSGNLYVVYQTLLAGNPKIAFTKSTDGGNTWSSPIAITDNPGGSGVFNPAVAVSADGQILTVVFYDHRANPGSNTLVDLYSTQSLDGGGTWQPNIRVTSVSTNASLAPLTGTGYMLGDYLGVADPTNANVPSVPVWIDTRTGDPDPFIARVASSPVPNSTPGPVPTPSVRVTVSPGRISEGGAATYTISASTINPFQATTIHYSMGGKARFGTDYTLSGVFGQADIPAGASSTTVVLQALTDAVREKKEKATMKLSSGANYRVSRPKKAKVTIVNAP